MEAMAIIGFVFGLAGLSYAMKAKTDIANLRLEFDEFKTSFENSDKSDQSDAL